MNDSHPYLAVVPAYNECATVGRVIRSILEHAPLYDVVVIDDGSTDATAAEAEAAGAKVISHPYNLGIGGAVQSGFTYALETGHRRLVQVDADGQHEPAERPQRGPAAGPRRRRAPGSRPRWTRTPRSTWSAARASSRSSSRPGRSAAPPAS